MAHRLNERIFTAESLATRPAQTSTSLPLLLLKARELENGEHPETRREIFYSQAQLLADYEDDFAYQGDPVRYYPTYQSLTDNELRGYFSWRTKVRHGEYAPGPATFIFLHIYELLNSIGVSNATEGYERLRQLRRAYGKDDENINYYLDKWLQDYIIYYNLPAKLLAEEAEPAKNQCISILDNIEREPQDRITEAVKYLVPKWLKRSKFYAEHFEDMDAVIYRVLRRMARHYAKSCKKTLVEQFFGIACMMHYHIFPSALFCDPLKRKKYEYRAGSQEAYICESGIWACEKRIATPRAARKLERILKTIDSIMRAETGYGHPIKAEISTRWIVNAIKEEIASFMAEKEAAAKKRLAIDFASLERIRVEAGETQERLITEDEMEQAEAHQSDAFAGSDSGASLGESERRLLHCLLYGGSLDWIRQEGLLLPVLVDGINDKLYDVFDDTVLDDSPELVADYIDSLKEMIPA